MNSRYVIMKVHVSGAEGGSRSPLLLEGKGGRLLVSRENCREGSGAAALPPCKGCVLLLCEGKLLAAAADATTGLPTACFLVAEKLSAQGRRSKGHSLWRPTAQHIQEEMLVQTESV